MVWCGRLSGRTRSHESGGDQQILLPAVEGQNLSVGVNLHSGGIRSHDRCLALGGNLINAEGAVGGGVVAHGVVRLN